MKLSIITINYNNKVGLEKTIDSVLCQTWQDFEWIIIDGGSTDGSKELIEAIKESCSKITYWCSEADEGVYNAMNKGIKHAQGDYIIFMNSGDVFVDQNVLHNFSVCSRVNDIYYGDWIKVYPDHEEYKSYPSPFDIYALYRRNICHQAMFIKSTLLKKCGFDESYKLLADYKRWIQAAFEGYGFEYLGFTVCKYDMSGMSSTCSTILQQESNRILEEYPQSVLKSIQKLDYYERYVSIQRVDKILRKKGVVRLMLMSVIKLFDVLFVHQELNNPDYNY